MWTDGDLHIWKKQISLPYEGGIFFSPHTSHTMDEDGRSLSGSSMINNQNSPRSEVLWLLYANPGAACIRQN